MNLNFFKNILLSSYLIFGFAIPIYSQTLLEDSLALHRMFKSNQIGFKSFKPNSVLKDGDWYKISVAADGVYKIDYTFLLTNVNLNPADLRFSTFGVFGTAMGILPEYNGASRIDDLEEIGIKIKDFNGNDIWDTNDYILFYAKGPHLWHYNQTNQKVSHTYNIYSETANYFFSTNKGSGKTITLENGPSVASAPISVFDDWYLYEKDENNLIFTELSGGAGTGRNWYGKQLNTIEPNQTINFTIPDLVNGEPLKIQAYFAAASAGSSSSFEVKYNGNSIFTKTLGALAGGSYPDVAVLGNHEGVLNNPVSTSVFDIRFTSGNSQAKGWLDYMEIIAKRNLRMNDSYVLFRSFASLTAPESKYRLSNANNTTEIWHVTQGTEITRMNATLSGTSLEFTSGSASLKEFAAVDVASTQFALPTFISNVANQNLHALPNVDYIIITTPTFLPAAEKLAAFHEEENDLSTEIVMLDHIYNEFSSGQQDLTAIRDFLKMFHDRNASFSEKLKYVLLLGDASFDYKDRIPNNQNVIPTYQSPASLSTVSSFCTDDYIGFLDDDEGLNMENNPSANLDMAIGRFPVTTLDAAQKLVDKIIYYKTNKSSNGWKNELTFVADDEDNNTHLKDAEEIINISNIERKDYYNFDKIYLDAFTQSNSAGGDRYPDVVDAILRKLFTGTLFVDYTGHGGPTNWAQERIFNIQDIYNLKNKDKLPLFMTATCDFSPFDDPTIVSAGEALLLNPDGGAIAMLSTTRLVFSHSNKQMNKAVLNYLFQKVDNRMPTIGEILQQAKNEAGSNDNNRKFVLLGDPALQLEYPKYEVVTTKINEKSILEQDTLKALSKAKIEGGIMDVDGALLTDFNGIIYANIYDKEGTYTTQGNDVGSPVTNYNLRNNLIFKGKASVVNGLFSFEFIVPKDINYSFGNGKITYYAERDDNPKIDAHGYSYQFKVGGTDPNFVPDNEGPIIEVFMNDTLFEYGGITDENPILYVRLKDESGINTIGNGVGHDIVAELDGNSQKKYLLNDYYEAALNDFTKGVISNYLLNNISEGVHLIEVKAWDVHNNPGEGFTEFIVASSAALALENVFNFPNPFYNSTSFVFEHNFPDQTLDVTIQIYTTNGSIVKTIQQQVQTNGYQIGANEIVWDGLSDSGSFIGRGMYLYKVNVQTSEGYNAFKFDKLVILK